MEVSDRIEVVKANVEQLRSQLLISRYPEIQEQRATDLEKQAAELLEKAACIRQVVRVEVETVKAALHEATVELTLLQLLQRRGVKNVRKLRTLLDLMRKELGS